MVPTIGRPIAQVTPARPWSLYAWRGRDGPDHRPPHRPGNAGAALEACTQGEAGMVPTIGRPIAQVTPARPWSLYARRGRDGPNHRPPPRPDNAGAALYAKRVTQFGVHSGNRSKNAGAAPSCFLHARQIRLWKPSLSKALPHRRHGRFRAMSRVLAERRSGLSGTDAIESF